ncbi:hypothetical protein [uncultured Roseivirga sp.]|uniref:hypothetical protein n=1 Tax=uncultured Roseivirga sp. TaxID=543088 RepID=UPI000D79F81F|nr:hypothetical protein [uncultured Roseivirga sp.]PWL29056.1 MAG: hypothetical protein DCO95_11495 [Roseivirga sp. XM-24bin3]
MNRIEAFLYQHQILKLSERKLERWNKIEAVNKLIFAARNGIFHIRLKSVELLSNKASKPEIESLIISMISDDVQVVSEAAMKVLENTSNSELKELIKRTKKEWKMKKAKKKLGAPYMANTHFGDSEKLRPRDRLMQRLRDQQQANQPPYGF